MTLRDDIEALGDEGTVQKFKWDVSAVDSEGLGAFRHVFQFNYGIASDKELLTHATSN